VGVHGECSGVQSADIEHGARCRGKVQRAARVRRHAVEVSRRERDVRSLARGGHVVERVDVCRIDRLLEDFVDDLRHDAAPDPRRHAGEYGVVGAAGPHDRHLHGATADVDSSSHVHQATILLAKRAAPKAPV
jgi:hypothetical protein